MSGKRLYGRLRSLAAAGCAACAFLPTAVNAQSTSGPILPMRGNISPFYGNISPFRGNISPFYGNIAPFYGNISPFYGNISPFWGNISPFSQPTDVATASFYGGKFDPFWGSGPLNPYTTANKYGLVYSQIGTFWQSESAAWATAQTAWARASTPADFASLASVLQTTIVNPASSFWSGALIKANAGTSVSAIASRFLAQAGITLNSDGSINPASLQGVSETQRAVLFLGLYDTLMSYSGTGHVDWWMGATGWSPALAQTEGKTPVGGSIPTVGMIDFVISNGQHISKQITQFGSTVFSDGHGAAVGSLIMGSVDGSGVMGVMPQGSVNVSVYDPYDATGTTNWTDVGTGVAALSAAIFKGKTVPVGVLNASLGVAGWTLNPGWNGALTNAGAHGHDLVIAAGNDGTTQIANVPWNFATNPTILIVGSVGVDGTISNFSNRPGEACLVSATASLPMCSEADKLKYRFIVAPGELILVSDGHGGIVRQSGTSLAAPLVSGAIAMLQNRWPWLSNYPDETAQIILKSATPMGTNPGADANYGVGELNIRASQSPLTWSALQYYPVVGGKASTTPVGLTSVVSQIASGSQSTWDATGLYFTAIETVGKTYRDFQIPLSSKLVGQTVTTKGGGQLYQSYLASALRAQAGHFAQMAVSDTPVTTSFGMAASGAPAGMVGGMMLRMNVAPRESNAGFASRQIAYQTDGSLTGDNASLQFGVGDGAPILAGQPGFDFHSDYDLGRGGANPLLGLASGGAYLNARAIIAPHLTVSIGTSQRRDTRELAAFGLVPGTTSAGLRHYAAQAQQVGVEYAVSPSFAVRSSFTFLQEASAALGVQSTDPADFRHGSVTTGATFGFDLALSHGLMLSGSGTIASTRFGAGQLSTGTVGLLSTAAQLGLTKERLFSSHDRLRLTLAKPLHVDGGHLTYSSVGVIDRETGELGVVTQSYAPTSGRTPIATGLVYGRSIMNGSGEFSVFGQAEKNADQSAAASQYMAGAQFHLAF